MVEFVFIEIKTADQRTDGAIGRVQRHKCAFDLGQLREAPIAFGVFADTYHRARAQFDIGRSLVGQGRSDRFQAVADDLQHLGVLPHHPHFFRRSLQHHGAEQIAFVTGFNQGVVNGFFKLTRIAGHGDEFFRPPIHLAQFIVQDAAAQGLVSDFLVLGLDGGVNVQTARVNIVAVLRKHQLARHLGHVFGMRGVGCGDAADFQFFGFRRLGLRRSDETVFFHALDDVELARAGAFGVVDRVVSRRRLGQTGEHGGLGNAQRLNRFAKISFRRSRETIGPVTQENLVQIDFKNLVFAEQMLEFVSQQQFVNFSGKGFL